MVETLCTKFAPRHLLLAALLFIAKHIRGSVLYMDAYVYSFFCYIFFSVYVMYIWICIFAFLLLIFQQPKKSITRVATENEREA